MWTDVRYAFRALAAGRSFSTVAIGCMAAAIAANAAMFSVFDAIFWRPLPFPGADALVNITGRVPESGRRVALSLADVGELSRTVSSVGSFAAYSGRTVTLTDAGEPERISAQLITANLFDTLGYRAVRGRGIEGTDDRTGAPTSAVISDGLWRRHFEHAESALGRTIQLDNVSYTIVGIMPPAFAFPHRTDVWIAMTPALGASGVTTRGISVLGRLAVATSIDRANAELAGRVLPAAGQRPARFAIARPLRAAGVGSEERTISAALMGATTVLLLIACANMANLLLARGAGRRREMALRAALGASRSRILRQVLIESLLLGLAAAVVALPLTWYAIGLVRDAVPVTDPMVPSYMQWAMDGRTFAYAVGIALVTALLFGLAPALDATGTRLQNPLREGAGAAGSRVQGRTHRILVVAQIALALGLLATASLFVRTYIGLARVPLGYHTTDLMTLRVYFAGPRYEQAAAREHVIDELAAKLAAVPGARAAMVSDLVPLDDQGGSDGPTDIQGRAFDEGKAPTVHYAGVAGQWPETFDVRVLQGRSFQPEELLAKTPVALVNQKLAATFWPGQDPIGRKFRIAEEENAPWLSVIGVVPDIRTVKLDESASTPPTAYLPHRFISTRNYGMVLRTAANPASVVPGVRAALREIDPGLALFDVYSMDQVRWLSYWMYVLWGTLFLVFGILALAIAGIGVYGVVYFTVARRTREIGLRVALGASRRQVVRPILRQSAVLAGTGISIGLVAAYFITPIVGSLLIGVPPVDPVGLIGVSVALAALAIIATWLPAWRASDVDPMTALRDE